MDNWLKMRGMDESGKYVVEQRNKKVAQRFFTFCLLPSAAKMAFAFDFPALKVAFTIVDFSRKNHPGLKIAVIL